jgi:Ca2+-binding EF-hand superfamily protein
LSSDEFEIPEDEVMRIIEEVDTNHDGEIDYNEFLEMMKKDLHN